MNKLLAFLLTLFLFSSVYTEARVVDKLEYRDGIAYAVGESEGFSGVYSYKWSNNNNALKVNYKNGKKDGEQISWYYNGILKSETLFQSGSQVRRIEYEFRDTLVTRIRQQIKHNPFSIYFVVYFGLIMLTYKAFLENNKVFRGRLVVVILLSIPIILVILSPFVIIAIAPSAFVWIPVILLMWIGFEIEARYFK